VELNDWFIDEAGDAKTAEQTTAFDDEIETPNNQESNQNNEYFLNRLKSHREDHQRDLIEIYLKH